MSIKIDLVELSKDRMKKLTVVGGADVSCCKVLIYNDSGQLCGCACAGTSSTYWNATFNQRDGLISPCQ
jgi:hypothetical protein